MNQSTGPERRDGFTLIELLVAFFIGMALFALVTTLLLRVIDFRMRAERAVSGVRTAAGIFTLLRRDLEGAMKAADPFVVNPAGLDFWASVENRFDTDAAQGNLQAQQVLRVNYWLQDGELYRKVRTRDPLVFADRLLARGIFDLRVQAYDANNNLLSPVPPDKLPRYLVVWLTLYSDRVANLDGDSRKITVTERADFLGLGSEAQALAGGRLRRFSETINIPAGDP